MYNLMKKKQISFYLGDKLHTINDDSVTPETSLNTYLREISHLTGTKRMCLEGGCGSCIVAVEDSVTKQIFAVNSCLVSIYSCHGWKILTIEGVGGPLQGYDPIQKLLADHNGSQCGFCSPGMVMNMYALTKTGPLTQHQIENSFGGNICRCTGYRPILEAFKSLASDTQNCPDIEDLRPCRNNCTKLENFWIQAGQSQWIKVHLLADLLQILQTVANKNYKLVAGNTAQGVYPPTQPSDVYIDISKVDELTTYSVNDKTLILGANLNLTATMKCFKKTAIENPNFSYLSKLADHLDLVANVPVRNIGTLAGNLMIKYTHNEFPSDIFLILETVNATIVIVDTNSVETMVSPANFLNVDMNAKVIKQIILTTRDNSYKYGSYKIMPKAQNSHALVNAGFLFQLNNNNIVINARMVYGSINKNFIHASNTENLLKSQNLFNNDVLQQAYNSLENELKAEEDPPEPPAQFRQQLAIALFYKYILSIAPDDSISPNHKSGATNLIRPLSQGHQEFGPNPTRYPVSKPTTKIEALAQTSGQAEYIVDIPDRPGQLYASFVLAKASPGSIITNMDPSEALKMEGVVAFYDKKDIPGKNSFTPTTSGLVIFSIEEEVFCSEKIKYFDQPIGLVVATSYFVAEQAAELVKITYTPPPSKPLLTIQQVLNANDKKRIIHTTTVVPKSKGKDIKHTINGEMYVDKQYHMHMELQCCNIVPTEDGLDIHASTQWMDAVQTAVATVLNLPTQKINMYTRRLGGAFGAKITRNGIVTAAASVAAYKLRKPVKMWMSLPKNMTAIGKRIPFYIKYEVGVNDSGVIQYLDADLYSDHGFGGNDPIDPNIIEMFPNVYNSDTWNYSTYVVKTDTPGNCYTRAPGTVEALAGIEHIFDNIAYNLNLDPVAVRLANIDAKSQIITGYLKDLNSWANINSRKTDIQNFNKVNRWKKRGMSILPLNWTLEIWAYHSVVISIFHADGGVAIVHSGIEMGQGINTKVSQVVAYKFNIPVEKISVKPSYNAVAPNATPSGGSLTSEAICYAAIQACDILLDRMKPIRDKMKNPSWEELIHKCAAEFVNLCATAPYKPGVYPQYQIYAVCAAEVEVDILTGQHQILRFDVIEDVGDSMNPTIDIGQLEGAIVMGIGYYTTENIIMDENGQILTNRTWNYYVPGPKDIPIDFRIKFPKDNPNPVGVLNSKAIAEPPICLTFAVPLAIRDAVSSARLDADATKPKWYPVNGCSNVSDTFQNSLNNFKQYTL